MTHRKKLIALAGTAALALAASSAHASLILADQAQLQGTGVGAVETILRIQSPGNSSTESGTSAWNGTSTVVSGDAQTGASQSGSPTLSSLGVTNAGDLRIVFNAIEPGGSGITLNNLVLTLYGPGGTTWNSGTFTPQTFATTQQGQGQAGYVFRLDTEQTGFANAALGPNAGAARIGLFAAASGAEGGPESFFAASCTSFAGTGAACSGGPGPTPGVVPEPSTWALMLAGLFGLGAVARRRTQKS